MCVTQAIVLARRVVTRHDCRIENSNMWGAGTWFQRPVFCVMKSKQCYWCVCVLVETHFHLWLLAVIISVFVRSSALDLETDEFLGRWRPFLMVKVQIWPFWFDRKILYLTTFNERFNCKHILPYCRSIYTILQNYVFFSYRSN